MDLHLRNRPVPGARMESLEPDIIFYVVDMLASDSEDAMPKAKPLWELSLINKHWAYYMERHRIFTAARFEISKYGKRRGDSSSEASIEDIRSWFMHPVRRKRIISSLHLRYFADSDYDQFRDMLDSALTDVTFNKLTIAAQDADSPDEEIRLPTSLDARHLRLMSPWGKHLFRFSSINQQLCDNLVSLNLDILRFCDMPVDIRLKSLKKLSILVDSETAGHEVNTFLAHHPKINDLKLHSVIAHPEVPLLRVDSLNGLESLVAYSLPVDLDGDKILSIKALALESMSSAISNWSCLSNTLTKLVLTETSVPPVHEIIPAGHDLVNPEKLYKLDNLKYFYVRHSSDTFAESFNRGMYDDAMPMLEYLHIDNLRITEEAYCRFISKHKHLTRIRVHGRHFDATLVHDYIRAVRYPATDYTYLRRNKL